MRKKLIARTAKLLSESKKGRRHQGIAVAYEHIPNDIDERNHGAIYAVININAEASMAEEVGTMIIDTFHGEFYQDLGRDPLNSFEAALSRVNEELAEVTHQGNTAWLGNLNAVLAVLVGDTLHLTQAGKAEAYLYRGSHSSHVTHDLNGDSINPLRTFINVASGELVEGDKVAIATPGVFYHISKDELQKYVEEFQPKVAISHLADLLEDNSSEIHPNSILIIEAITPEAASEETVEDLDDEVWISEPARPVQTALDASAPVAKRILVGTKKVVDAVSSFALHTAWPKIKALTLEAVDITKHLFNHVKESKKPKTKEKILVETTESIISDGGKENFEDLTINETSNSLLTNEKQNAKNAIYIKEAELTKPRFLNIDMTTAKTLTSKVKRFTKKLGPSKKKIFFAATALLIIAIVGIFAYAKINESTAAKKQAETTFEQATADYNEGKSLLDAGNKTEAASILETALSLAKSLQNDDNLKAQATELIAQIQGAIDTAENVIRVNASNFSDASSIVGADTLGPLVIDENMYIISKTNGNIASIDIESGETSAVLTDPNYEGAIVAAAAVTARNVLVIVTNSGDIYEFDTVDLELNQQTTLGEVETPAAIAAYSTNIYSLDSETGKIYRRVKVSGGYGERSEYIDNGTSVNGAVSIAIDGNIYVMRADGTVNQYLSGEDQNYSVSGLTANVSNANFLFANEEVSGIYELEGSASRVIQINAGGEFVSQYVSDAFANASGIYVDDTTNTLYVSASGKIYTFNF